MPGTTVVDDIEAHHRRTIGGGAAQAAVRRRQCCRRQAADANKRLPPQATAKVTTASLPNLHSPGECSYRDVHSLRWRVTFLVRKMSSDCVPVPPLPRSGRGEHHLGFSPAAAR